MILRAKIRRALFHSYRRREIRAYECPKRPGTWHTTSQEYQAPERVSKAAPARARTVAQPWRTFADVLSAVENSRDADPRPTYPRGDLQSARKWVLKALWFNTAAWWAPLSDPDRLDDTYTTLRRLGDEAKQEQLACKAAWSSKRYKAWLIDANSFQDRIQDRYREFAQYVKQRNISMSKNRSEKAKRYLHDVVRRLALEIAEHQRATETATEADARLWRLLDEVGMEDNTALRAILDAGGWTLRPTERALNGIPEHRRDTT